MTRTICCIGACTILFAQLSDAAILTSGTVGTAAPPAMLGPYMMTPFGDDLQPEVTGVTSVAGPQGGQITFSQSLTHFDIPVGWSQWSHGYTGDVYWTITAHQVTLTFPPGTKAFYFYAEPNSLQSHQFTATAQDGTALVQSVSGPSGATYFGFYGTSGSVLQTITIQSTADFAIGEFGIVVSTVSQADLNGDGAVNGLDIGILLSQWGTAGTADLNGDGIVDGLDIGVLLANWG